MTINYYLQPSSKIEELKTLFRKHEEWRVPGRMLNHLDERRYPPEVTDARYVPLKDLLQTCPEDSTVVIKSWKESDPSAAEIREVFEKRKNSCLKLVFLDDWISLSSDDEKSLDILYFTEKAEKKASKRAGETVTKLFALTKVDSELKNALRQERAQGTAYKEISKKFNLSIGTVFNHTKDVKTPRKEDGRKERRKNRFTYQTPTQVIKDGKFDQALFEFLETKRKSGSKRVYIQQIRAFLDFYGEKYGYMITSPSEISLQDAVQFRDQRIDGGKTQWTVRGELYALKTFLNFSLKAGFIRVNPLERLSLPKVERHVVRTEPMSRREVQAIIEAAQQALDQAVMVPEARWKAHRDLLAVFLLSSVGMRHSSLLELRKKDLTRSQEQYHLTLKSKVTANRYKVVVHEKIAEAIHEYVDQHMPDAGKDDYLFHPRFGRFEEHMSLAASSKRLVAIFQRAGISDREKEGKGRCAHSLRVSWATFAHEEGIDLKTLQTNLNHQNVAQTLAYIKMTEKPVDPVWTQKIRGSRPTSEGGLSI